MDGKEKILLENFSEYMDSAEKALKEKKYNVSVTLFFKAITAASDLFLLRKEGIVPSSHTDRFRILQSKHEAIYDMVDRDFPFYQDSYTKKMDEEAAKLLKEDAQTIKKFSEK